jgi:hypothetical protein
MCFSGVAGFRRMEFILWKAAKSSLIWLVSSKRLNEGVGTDCLGRRSRVGLSFLWTWTLCLLRCHFV